MRIITALADHVYSTARAPGPCCPLRLAAMALGADSVLDVPARAIGGARGALAIWRGGYQILLSLDLLREERIETCAHELGEWALEGEGLAHVAREAAAEAIGAELLRRARRPGLVSTMRERSRGVMSSQIFLA